MRRVLGAGCGLVGIMAVLLGWAPGAGGDEAPTNATVSMKEFTFKPATITVAAGGTVTWTYDESASDLQPNCESPYFQPPSPVACGGHSSTAVDNGPDGKPLWDSGLHRGSGFPYTHRFTTPGTFHYICVLHGGPNPNNPVTHMEGDVVVVAAGQSGSGSGSPSGTVTGSSPQDTTATVLASNDRTPKTLAATGGSFRWAAGAAGVLLLALAARAVSRASRLRQP